MRTLIENNQLDFLTLLNRALQDWPEEILLVESNGLEQPEDYKIYSIVYDISMLIHNKYLGTQEEVLAVNLNFAIYTAMHKTLTFLIKIKPVEVRADAIKKDFDRRLHDAISDTDCGWTDSDKRLAQAYLDSNP